MIRLSNPWLNSLSLTISFQVYRLIRLAIIIIVIKKSAAFMVAEVQNFLLIELNYFVLKSWFFIRIGEVILHSNSFAPYRTKTNSAACTMQRTKTLSSTDRDVRIDSIRTSCPETYADALYLANLLYLAPPCGSTAGKHFISAFNKVHTCNAKTNHNHYELTFNFNS